MRDDTMHIDEGFLIAYVDDPASVRDPAVGAHVSSCEACAAEVAELRSFADDLRDDATWWAAGPGADLSAAVRELALRCEAEDAEAEAMMRPILESQYLFLGMSILRKVCFQTGGVVRLLCEEARLQCVKEPLFALVLAEAAYTIADKLPEDYYPAGAVFGLRGNARKDYSTACRYLGQIDAGFEALKHAEKAYRKLPDPGVELAVVSLCRAGLFFERGRYPDALQHVRSAASRFEQRLERSRYFQAKEVEAAILHRMGDVESARTTYEEAGAFADRLGDPDMKARAARNLGIAYREAGDVDRASRYFLTALQLYDALGAQSMVVQTRWSIAALSVAAGNAGDAAERLPAIVSDLTALGIVADAGRAQLDLAEALLILREFDAVEAACAGLVEFFTRAEMLTGALRAASYLKECAAARRLTRGDLETVRKYLSDLERAPDLVFAPPPG